MPSVNLSSETYQKLKLLAQTKGCSADALAQAAVEAHVQGAGPEWAERWAEIEAKPVEELSEDEIHFEIDRTVDEVRAEAYARKLTPEQRIEQWRVALAEVRAGIPAESSEAELTAEIDAALEEVRAERRARRR